MTVIDSSDAGKLPHYVREGAFDPYEIERDADGSALKVHEASQL